MATSSRYSYCASADLSSYGIRAEALTGVTPANLQLAIADASAEIDGYLRARYKLPLASWGTDLTAICCRLAVYRVMMIRGFNAARAGDEQIRLQYEDAVHTLGLISQGRVHPNIVDSSSTAQGEAPGAFPIASSYRSRGYMVPDGYHGGAFQGRR